MNWHAVAPKEIADAQVRYEAAMLIIRARESGLTFPDIARRFNICIGEARRRYGFALRYRTPPIQKWFTLTNDVRALAKSSLAVWRIEHL